MGVSLENKIALVTGASRGIGAAIAINLAKKGALVIGTATSSKGTELIKQAFEANKVTGFGLELNVNNSDSISQLISTINDKYGEINILVNNAGITKDNLMMRMKDEDWDKVIDTNLKSIYKLSKSVIKSMIKSRSGRIINISSVVGHMGNAGQTNYAAAKAGVIGFSKSLAREVGARGITVNAVAPGFIDTDMTSSLADEHKTALLLQVPIKRLGTPEEIAGAVSYLASDDAAYITGETIHVNGGMLMI